MGNRIINAALAERLKAHGRPTAYENASFEPKTGVLYLRESFLPAQTVNVGLELGSTQDFKGIYQVLVMAPRDINKLDGFKEADRVAAHFPRGLALVREGITVRVEQVSTGPGFQSGDRWAIPVSINYRALIK